MLLLNPQDYNTHYNMGVVLKSLQRYFEAERHYQKAIQLTPKNSDLYNALGNLLLETGRIENAIEVYEKAIKLNPAQADACCSIGLCYVALKKFTEAEAVYRNILKIDSQSQRARFNLGTLLLSQGRFDEGWQYYETPYRYYDKFKPEHLSKSFMSLPKWQGESIAGKSIIIWYEQGYGDVIQFSRYIRLLKDQGAKLITFICKRPMKRLLQTLDGIDHVAATDDIDVIPEHDFWAFILSLPLYLKTRIDNVPSKTGYFKISPQRGLGVFHNKEHKFKLGLVWRGSQNQANDQRVIAHIRELKPLWEVRDICFFSLQRDAGREEITDISHEQPMVDCGKAIHDFFDAASFINEMDLVISVDTAFLHLAGAMGKPTWAMLPFVADWRWMIDREDSPWYPSMRLFRQPKRGDWVSVVERIRSCLVDKVHMDK